jgi:tetratricopeptide (TPR) repeat protein
MVSGYDRDRALAVLREAEAQLRAGDLVGADANFAVLGQLTEQTPEPGDVKLKLRLIVAKSYEAWVAELVRDGRFRDAVDASNAVADRYETVRSRDEDDILARVRRLGATARNEIATVLSRDAETLFESGSYAEVITVNDRLIEMARDSSDGGMDRFVVLAMSGTALALEELGRWAEADSIYGEMAALVGQATDVPIRGQVARALARNAAARRAQGRLDHALARWNQILDLFSDDPSPEISSIRARAHIEQVELLVLTRGSGADRAADDATAMIADSGLADRLRARLMSASAAAYLDAQRFADAVALVDAMVREYGDFDDAMIRRQVALGLDNKLAALAGMGLVEEAKRAYDDMVGSFGDSVAQALGAVAAELERKDDRRLNPRSAIVRCKQAMVLGDLGRQDEAGAVLDTLLARYAPDGDAELEQLMATARSLRETIDS